jgi:hypothetical protein
MTALPRRRPRRTLLLGAALTGAAVLTGCGAQQAGGEAAGDAAQASVAPAAGTAAEPSGALADVADLSAGLLPAEAFGAGGVAPLTAEELAQQVMAYGGSMAGAPEGLTVTPEGCAGALEAMQGTQPHHEDLDGFAAQMAKANGTTVLTVQALAAGPAVAGAVEQLVAGVTACPEATVAAPMGSATVVFRDLQAPELGDGAAVVSVTATAGQAGGQPVTAPVLLGLVQDGDRLVTLLSSGPDAALDPAAFGALLEQAYQH